MSTKYHTVLGAALSVLREHCTALSSENEETWPSANIGVHTICTLIISLSAGAEQVRRMDTKIEECNSILQDLERGYDARRFMAATMSLRWGRIWHMSDDDYNLQVLLAMAGGIVQVILRTLLPGIRPEHLVVSTTEISVLCEVLARIDFDEASRRAVIETLDATVASLSEGELASDERVRPLEKVLEQTIKKIESAP